MLGGAKVSAPPVCTRGDRAARVSAGCARVFPGPDRIERAGRRQAARISVREGWAGGGRRDSCALRVGRGVGMRVGTADSVPRAC